ncbi:MAG TPA: ABC transporter substrate-binding protein [Streptosporangiaceae bacterium]
MRTRKTLAVAAAAVAAAMLAAGCGSSSSAGGKWKTADTVAAGGGMAALVKAAKAEGTLNVITLPADWANYGNIMKDFTAKYGIKINDANPDGSSQDEINAMQQLKGQSRAPDVLDMGTAFAIKADQERLLAPYKVAEWNNIPAAEKSTDGTWFGDYGGYVAIGYNSKTVKTPPTSFKALLSPAYKNEVGINGNPTQASAAFSAVYAAALANGGSLANIEPGIQFFAKLKQVGNFVPVTAGPTTVSSGQTPIVVWWDYLLASRSPPRTRASRSSSRVTRVTRRTTTRPSARPRRTRRRPGCGRSTCTPSPGRTSGWPARRGRSSCRRWCRTAR